MESVGPPGCDLAHRPHRAKGWRTRTRVGERKQSPGQLRREKVQPDVREAEAECDACDSAPTTDRLPGCDRGICAHVEEPAVGKGSTAPGPSPSLCARRGR